MAIEPLDSAVHAFLVKHLGSKNADAVIQGAEEATQSGWAQEWFAKVAHKDQRHILYLYLAASTSHSGKWKIENKTEDAEADDTSTSWICGRRDRHLDDSGVTFSVEDRGRLQKLIGTVNTSLLVRSANAASQRDWAKNWFATVTHTSQRHVFKLVAASDSVSGWRIASHVEDMQHVHPGLSWACGRQMPRKPCAGGTHRGKPQADGSGICRICADRFPDMNSSAHKHRCWVCHVEYEILSKAGRGNHRQRPYVPLACAHCRDAGYSAYDVQSYECQNCNGSFGHRHYRTADIRNHRKRKSGSLVCRTCRRGHTCACCHKVHDTNHWSKDQLKKHRSLQRPLVCKECVAIGQKPRKHQSRTSRRPARQERRKT